MVFKQNIRDLLWSCLRFLPKNFISYFFGLLAYKPLPKYISLFVVKTFASFFKIEISEAEKDISEYSCLGEFFIRNLKHGCRPISDGIISPVDGVLSQFGEIIDGLAVQVKGKTYAIEDLLDRDSEFSKCFDKGFYISIYLSPRDYHHIHSPVSGMIAASSYLKGKLWPVNSWSLNNIDNLFIQNERIVTFIQSQECGLVAVVKVGATNVGSIALSYDKEVISNSWDYLFEASRNSSLKTYVPQIPIAKGERLATFRLGSTVILIFQKQCFFQHENLRLNDVLKMGQKIGIARENNLP